MNINYHSLFTLIAVAIALLPGFILLDRWSRERSYDLQGKTILLTGGSRGLGLVMARQLLEAGAQLAICARDEAELERAQSDLAQRDQVFALTCDVTDQRQVEQMIQQVRDHFGFRPVASKSSSRRPVWPPRSPRRQSAPPRAECAGRGRRCHPDCRSVWRPRKGCLAEHRYRINDSLDAPHLLKERSF